MKINSIVAKTALAAAIAGASFAASAGQITISTPAVVAIELFGDAGNSNRDSDNTAITLPTIQFDATAGNLSTATSATDVVSIKLTLAATHAKWAFSYDNPNDWGTQGIEVVVDGAKLVPADIVGVDAGTVGNNTITIKFTKNNVDLTKPISLKGFKVNKLKDTHSTVDGETKVNIEVRNEGNNEYDTSDNETAIYSAKGVVLDGARTSYADGAESDRGYIQVGKAQQSFTDWETGHVALGTANGNSHRDDFEKSTAVLYLGDMKITRGVKVGVGAAGKEGGTLFDISGGDRVTLSLKGDASLKEYGLTLRTAAGPGVTPCDTTGTALAGTAVVDTNDSTKATITLPSTVVDLGAATSWNLCATANIVGDERIQQLSSLRADIAVDYTNTTYGKSSDSYDYKEVLSNGCQVTLFNLPNVTAADKAMIRFTNTSEKAGQVNAYAYLENGKKVDVDALLVDNIPAHGTVGFSTTPGVGVYLGEAMPEFGAETSGRARIVIQGAFPSCEALGMVRSSNGTLVNMTSTTNSDSATNAVGTYGTSNTSN